MLLCLRCFEWDGEVNQRRPLPPPPPPLRPPPLLPPPELLMLLLPRELLALAELPL
jgi:hypothetical protein